MEVKMKPCPDSIRVQWNHKYASCTNKCSRCGYQATAMISWTTVALHVTISVSVCRMRKRGSKTVRAAFNKEDKKLIVLFLSIISIVFVAVIA